MNRTNKTRLTSMLALAAVLAAGRSAGQDVDSELTMTAIPDPAATLPDAVMRDIELPEAAADEGVLNSAEGLATANENREEAAENRAEALERAATRRQAGLDIAAEARERGAELGAEIAEAAAAGREQFVRGDEGLELPVPDHLPELPGPADGRAELPDRPGPPDDLPTPQQP